MKDLGISCLFLFICFVVCEVVVVVVVFLGSDIFVINALLKINLTIFFFTFFLFSFYFLFL